MGKSNSSVAFRNINKLGFNGQLSPSQHGIDFVEISLGQHDIYDGWFFRLKKVEMHKYYRDKINFMTTPWGAFYVDKVSFGMLNAGDTFQSATT